MSVTPIRPMPNRNCSAECSHMLGGHCTGDDCPYRSQAPTDAEWLKDWAVVDYREINGAAYDRGLRDGHRNARIQYGMGRFVGFIQGVLSLGIALGLLWIVDWLAAR